jgi:two-component system, LytTR family, response regulator
VKVLLADDEIAARERLRQLLAGYPELVIVGEARDGVDALAKVATLQPDVLFLDIEMPALDGIAVARALGPKGPRVVFVTAYDDFALAAFENAAVDYLVKPVTEERLQKTVERLRDRHRPALDETLLAIERKRPSRRFAVKSGAEYHLVDLAKMSAIIAEDKYAVVKGLKNEILCDETLDSLGARLDPERFMRVHRAAIVSLSAVARLEREGDRKYVLVLNDGMRVPVSRDRLDEVRSALGIRD